MKGPHFRFSSLISIFECHVCAKEGKRALTGRAASEKKPPERPRISSAAGRDDAALRDDAVIAKAMGYRVERKSFWMKSSRSASRHWAISISHARSAVTRPLSGSHRSRNGRVRSN